MTILVQFSWEVFVKEHRGSSDKKQGQNVYYGFKLYWWNILILGRIHLLLFKSEYNFIRAFLFIGKGTAKAGFHSNFISMVPTNALYNWLSCIYIDLTIRKSCSLRDITTFQLIPKIICYLRFAIKARANRVNIGNCIIGRLMRLQIATDEFNYLSPSLCYRRNLIPLLSL